MTLSDGAHAQGGLLKTLRQFLWPVTAPDSAVGLATDGVTVMLPQVHQMHVAGTAAFLIPARVSMRR